MPKVVIPNMTGETNLPAGFATFSNKQFQS